ncbi:cytochrome b [Mitsuaria sp. WAJ17]|uniref:cytochrome b n=1 Tax=Mitsuaria sp. WAJ17 TaxID=2761452 RepID=UPI0015FF3E89|nr:cytochrome b/b6 domain-containing protein [Mitsuaria sp. WAJ17]MBB2487965.1 cytochrome b [Mitsuaria sp. WAJ17]
MADLDKLPPSSRLLHWLVAALMLGLAGMGLYMSRTEAWALYPWHKSLGVIALLFIALRLGQRLRLGLPDPVQATSPALHLAARWAHGALLALTLLMPLSGMLFSGASGHGFGVFGLTLVPHQDDPAKPGEVLPYNATLADLGHQAHHWLGYLLLLLVALHVLAALKHHVIDRDRTLLRMLGRKDG